MYIIIQECYRCSVVYMEQTNYVLVELNKLRKDKH